MSKRKPSKPSKRKAFKPSPNARIHKGPIEPGYITEATGYLNLIPAAELGICLRGDSLVTLHTNVMKRHPDMIPPHLAASDAGPWLLSVGAAKQAAFVVLNKHAPALLPTWDAASPDWQGLCLAVERLTGLSSVERFGLPKLAQAVADAAAQKIKAETAAEPLSDTEQLAFDIINEQPDETGISGKLIVTKMGERGVTITEEHFRKRIVPRLKACRGVKNRPGVGYYVQR